MAPRGGNEKKESGRAKKAENANKKKESEEAERERKEAEKWSQGAKGKNAREEREEKRLQELKKKEERQALLAAEEASLAAAKPKVAPKASAKKKPVAPRPAGPGAIPAGGGVAGALAKTDVITTETTTGTKTPPVEVESFSARGIYGALELMDVVTAKTDKESRGQAAAGLERHPERRFKAAFAAFEEREAPKLKEEHPGLRKNQLTELLYKKFKKSSENPFNQASVAYNASKEEKLDTLQQTQEEIEERLRDRLQLDSEKNAG